MQIARSVVVRPAADTLLAGDTLRLAAEAFDANGHPVAGAEFAWSSSDSAVAAVDTAGLATAAGPGRAAVTATSGDASGQAELLVIAPAPAAIRVTPDSVALAALGDTIRLAAEVLDQRGRAMEDEPVSWSSGDEAVATVDPGGLVTAVGTGSAEVAASSRDVSAATAVTVMQIARSVVVRPAADTLLAGDTLRLAAEAFDANGRPVAGAEFAWSSSDSAVATVDGAGLVTAHSRGAAVIAAVSGRATGRMELLIREPMPSVIDVTPDTVALTARGDTVRLMALVLDPSGHVIEDPAVSWSSGHPSIVTVDVAGLVTAHRPGRTRVTAASGEAAGHAELVVVAPAPFAVRVTPGTVPLSRVGDTARLTAEVRDQLGRVLAAAAVSWSSDDESVATVDATGLIRGVGPGIASITAAAGNARASSQVVVGNPDRAVLAAFYDATDGPQWFRSDNWMTGAPIRDWYGVDVSPDGRVSQLRLEDNNVSGRIPPELGYLTGLRELYISDNQLFGPIPPEIGGLDDLTQIDLTGNQLTGEIPPELAKLADLRTLRLNRNRLTGPVPPELGRLASLTRLELNENRLTGPIPARVRQPPPT